VGLPTLTALGPAGEGKVGGAGSGYTVDSDQTAKSGSSHFARIYWRVAVDVASGIARHTPPPHAARRTPHAARHKAAHAMGNRRWAESKTVPERAA
jgi:hypothetical protein